MPQPGDVLAGRFRLDELVGRGGMATVYRGWDTLLGRPVAVKLLRPEITADPDLALRFRREAHAAAVLHHPNVVGYLGAGSEGDTPFLVMELVDGDDLATRIRHEAPLLPAVAASIAQDVANGLAIAHARGIVHRDVKPGNILVDADGRARITDFGVARIAAEAEATIPGTTLGSVHYFSPEQAQGLATTPPSDVYSLGLVLFEMLTGTRPFGGETPAAIALARVGAPAPSPRAVNPAVPADIDAVVVRALNPDPSARFAEAGAFADALDRCLAPRAPVDALSTTSRYTVPRVGSGRPATARSSVAAPLLGLLAALVLVVASIGAILALGSDPDQRTGLAATTPPDPGTAVPPTPDPSVPPAATAAPTPEQSIDLCEPDPGATCALAAGFYAPSRFEPQVSIELDEGWGAFRAGNRLMVLAREEGYLTLASGDITAFDGDQEYAVRPNATAVADAFASDPAIEVVDRARARVDGHPAIRLDLVPSGDRAPLFGSGGDVFYAEPETVTRVYVFEVRGELLILALEGANGVDLNDFLDAADGALSSLDLG
ncbi:MAG TPA: protein kinase [Candidatus Limnocylindrales bacterium]|nr:protein kinase [Candidatus Limnocylindrales bacterium]